MKKITNKINNKIRKYIKNNNLKNILLCVSGGADSIVLFHSVLKSKQYLDFNFSICHYNHMTRKKSNLDALLCMNVAKKYKITFYNDSMLINTNTKMNETNLRNNRYSFINKIYHNNNFDSIFTAHHADDQIETYLMRKNQTNDSMILTGIRKKYKNLHRPLLEISKDEIYSYAKFYKLNWNEDESNKNINHLRNNIRNTIIPNMIVKDLNFKNKMLDKINFSIEKSKLIKDKVNSFLESKVVFRNERIFINKGFLLKEEDFVIKYIIKKIISLYFKDKLNFSNKHLSNFIFFLRNKNNNINFQICKNIIILKYNDDVVFYKKSFISNKNIKIINDNINWNFHGLSVVDTINDNYYNLNFFETNIIELNLGLFLRSWISNDVIVYNEKGNKKKIKKVFSESKILPLFRKEIPVIVNYKNEVLWIPGIKKKYNKNNLINNKKYLLWQKLI